MLRGRGGPPFGNGIAMVGRNNAGLSMENFDEPLQKNSQLQAPSSVGRGGRGGICGGRGAGRGFQTPNFNDEPLQDPQPQAPSSLGRGGRGGICGGRGAGRGFQTANLNDEPLQDSQPQASLTASVGRGGRGGIRGGRGAGRGGFQTANLNDEPLQDSQPQAPLTASVGRGGRGGIRGSRGGFQTQNSNDEPLQAPSTVGRGGRGGGGGRGRFITTGANAEQFLAIGQEKNSEHQRGTSTKFYIPRTRAIEDIYQEDDEHQQLYMEIPDADEEVLISSSVPIQKKKISSWDELKLDQKLCENIVIHSKYIRPRKIQASAIPFILDGHDVMGVSETGSGKTAAFMVPIIQKIIEIEPNKRWKFGRTPAPFAIVIVPTRELCLQLYDQTRKLTNGTFVKPCKVYGEYSFPHNLHELNMGCDILLATTGRFLHIVRREHIDLSNVIFLVLDEADHMLDSFSQDVRNIISLAKLPSKEMRQTLLFSATFPCQVQELANEVLRNGSIMATNQKIVSPNIRIQQTFIQSTPQQKCEILKELLEKVKELAEEKDPVNPKYRLTMVFVETKRDADRLALFLVENGIRAVTINSDRKQEEREYSLRKFRTGEVNVLVSTDVCARGIDIKDMDHVINFDMPRDDVTYVHRIGRAGRLQCGYATSFVDMDRDASIIPEIIKLLRESNQEVPFFMTENTEH